MGVSKVIYGGNPIIDISDSTVTAESLEAGKIAYGANGEKIMGTAKIKNNNLYCNEDGLYPELAGEISNIKVYGEADYIIFHGNKFETHLNGNGYSPDGTNGVNFYDGLTRSEDYLYNSNSNIFFNKTNVDYNISSDGQLFITQYIQTKYDSSYSSSSGYPMFFVAGGNGYVTKGPYISGNILVTCSDDLNIVQRKKDENGETINFSSKTVYTTADISGDVRIFGYAKKQIDSYVTVIYSFNGNSYNRYIFPNKWYYGSSGRPYLDEIWVDKVLIDFGSNGSNQWLGDDGHPYYLGSSDIIQASFSVSSDGQVLGLPDDLDVIPKRTYSDKLSNYSNIEITKYSYFSFSELDIVVIPE